MSMVAVTSNEVQTATNYKFTFTVVNNLHSDSMIQIKLPTLVTGLVSGTCAIQAKSTSINGLSPVCQSVTGTRTISVSNPFLSNGAASWDYIVTTANAIITLTINGATNPISSRDAGLWSVTTYNLVTGAFYEVDSGTASTSFTPTSGTLDLTTLPGNTLTINNFVTYADTGLYTFQLRLKHNIPVYGFVSVTLPSDLSVSSASRVRASCYYGTTNIQQTCSLSATNSNQINMQLVNGHSSGATLQMSFNGIRNPRSTKPSSAFVLQTMDRDLFTIDTSTLFSVTMTTPGDLQDISVNMINSTNGAMTNHSVSFQTSIPLINGDKFLLTFTSSIRFNATFFPVLCIPVSLITAMTCSVSGQILTVTLTTLTTSPSTGTYQFTIANITNPPNTRVQQIIQSVSYVDSSISAYGIMNMPSTKLVSL